MKSLLAPIAIVFATVGCSALSAAEKPIDLKVTDLEARMLRVERIVDNQSLIQLSTELEQLRAENAQLRGEIETLRHETENGGSRQRDLYVDLDRRLQALEQGQRGSYAAPPPVVVPAPAQTALPVTSSQSAPPPRTETPAAAAARPGGTDQQNYQAAFELIQARKYEEAGRAFTQFLAQFATSPLADNAQYWLAETHYVRRDFTGGLPEFQKVVDKYPQSAKLPDALLKVGYCQIELGKRDQARTTLQQVVRQYPDTTAARLASQRLDRLSQEGG